MMVVFSRNKNRSVADPTGIVSWNGPNVNGLAFHPRKYEPAYKFIVGQRVPGIYPGQPDHPMP